jgi:ubiquinone/menaquinone biosynthesis C-methylase UbiE
MTYALESHDEVRRLEGQSKTELYDFKKETREFLSQLTGPLLDAGSGSGMLSRYFADSKAGLEVVGCDFSEVRLQGARELASNYSKVKFVQGNLTKLPFADNFFGGVVCRFVLEHLSREDQTKAVSEFYRCVRPGGWICLIDLDGMYENLSPRPPMTAELLRVIEEKSMFDVRVGRRLPQLAHEAGFTHISRTIETMDFQGPHRDVEHELMRERLMQARPILKQIFGSDEKVGAFEFEFLSTMKNPGAVLFYNKFIILAQKPKKTVLPFLT